MQHIKTILLWIASLWYSDINSDLRRDIITKWVSLLGKYIRTKGLVWTIRRIKLIRLVVTRYLSGSPLQVVDALIGIEGGFPKAILFMKELIDSGRPTGIRFILTLLTVSRAIKCETEPNFDSITMESKAKFTTIDPNFVTKFVSDFGLELFRPVWSRSLLFFTLKGGPLGNPVITAIHALKYYSGPMWAAMIILVGIDGAQYLKGLWMKYRDHIKWNSVEAKIKILAKMGYLEVPSIRRLSIVQDPELKARVVAIVDYFTQVVLQPLSEQLFNLLRSMPQDRTFTQDPHIVRKAGNKYHSLDLSNATDRFPLELQKQLLAEMLGVAYAHSWGVLMTFNDFLTSTGRRIRYAVGQPMGARSSWPMFTLTHHLVVQYAAFLAGKYPFKDYILLGDDIVITDDKVASEYVKLMTGLGVEISPHKTHVSETTYEFAKRWFHNGIEVTGFPVNSIKSTLGAPLELFNAVLDQFNRGLVPLNFTRSVECVVKLYAILGWSQRKLNSLTSTLEPYLFTLRNLKSPNPDEIRAFFAANTWQSDEYVIPASEIMLVSELTRVSSAVLNGIVMGLLYRLNRYQAKLDAMIADIVEPGDSGIETNDWPLRDSIHNGIQKLLEIGDKINVFGELMPLLETTTVVDLDLLRKRQRKSVVILYRLSSFGKGLRNQLRDDPNYVAHLAQNFKVKKTMIDLGRGFSKVAKR